jgi:predicted nucleic acid-binding protein
LSAIDTSVAVPALLSWHENHDACRSAARGARIPAHAVVETYSVLTRLPSNRLSAEDAAALLQAWFPPDRILTLTAEQQRRLVPRLVGAGVDGGSTYDGLVALTAKAKGERLVSFDRRAAATYEALGVEFELLDL